MSEFNREDSKSLSELRGVVRRLEAEFVEIKGMLNDLGQRLYRPTNWGWAIAGASAIMFAATSYTNLLSDPLQRFNANQTAFNTSVIQERQADAYRAGQQSVLKENQQKLEQDVENLIRQMGALSSQVEGNTNLIETIDAGGSHRWIIENPEE